MKKTQIIRLLAVLLALALLCGCGGGGNTESTPETNKPAESTPPATKPEDTGKLDGMIYFNVDKGATRTLTGTGFYAIRLVGGTGKMNYLVIGEAAMKKIDSMDYMGLKFNAQGLIVDAVTLAEMECTMDETGVTLDAVSGTQGTAGTTQLKFAADCKAYDVSNAASMGTITTLRAQDVIKTVRDKDGNIKAAFITSRFVKKILCPHCNTEIAFQEWTKADSFPNAAEGHYALATDIELNGQFNMPKDSSVVLDLNGHKITGKTESRLIAMFNENCYLAIMDTSEAKTGKIVVTGDNLHDGGCVWVRYGTFDFYSGTLDASQARAGRNGTAVAVNAGQTFNMHGGTIIGGTNFVSDYTRPDGTESMLGGLGGSVYVGGTMTMTGGEIKNGTAEARKNGEEFIAGGYGGNVYVSSAGKFEMSAGTIHGGKADRGEQDVYVHETGKFIQTGGTVGTPSET